VINFRYHVVSLTAVFLALAIGLVVGTAALNGPVADTLKNRVDGLSKDNGNLREQVNQLNDQVNREEDFATEAAPALIGNTLTGRKVLVVVMPSGQDFAEGVVSMLEVAGATVTARVTLQDKFLAPENDVQLLYLADKAAQTTIPSDGLPVNSYGAETSSALLALGLLQHTQTVAPNDLKALLTAYSTSDFIAVDDNAVGGAEATVIVSGLPAIDRDAAKKSQAAVTLTTQFAKDRPVVVAGTGIGEGNLVSEVRGDPTLVKTISTVDNASTAQGQLVTAMVTGERLLQDRAGQYGVGAGATSLIPKQAA
jgi:hypothetical protein